MTLVMSTLRTVAIATSAVFKAISALVAEGESAATFDKVAASLAFHPKFAHRTLFEISLFHHSFEHFVEFIGVS
jgi:hypothetical protein